MRLPAYRPANSRWSEQSFPANQLVRVLYQKGGTTPQEQQIARYSWEEWCQTLRARAMSRYEYSRVGEAQWQSSAKRRIGK